MSVRKVSISSGAKEYHFAAELSAWKEGAIRERLLGLMERGIVSKFTILSFKTDDNIADLLVTISRLEQEPDRPRPVKAAKP